MPQTKKGAIFCSCGHWTLLMSKAGLCVSVCLLLWLKDWWSGSCSQKNTFIMLFASWRQFLLSTMQVLGKVSLKKDELYKYHQKEHWFPLATADAESEVQVSEGASVLPSFHSHPPTPLSLQWWSPWYNDTGWLGVKHQFTCLLPSGAHPWPPGLLFSLPVTPQDVNLSLLVQPLGHCAQPVTPQDVNLSLPVQPLDRCSLCQ